MPLNKTRVTFSCSKELQAKLSKRADSEGIPRSQLIVELLESAIGTDDQEGVRTKPEVNRFLFDVQSRIAELEKWRREISEWRASATTNTDNLESTIASILNQQLVETGIDQIGKDGESKKIPTPKK